MTREQFDELLSRQPAFADEQRGCALLTLWWLESRRAGASSQGFLYGWLIPRPSSAAAEQATVNIARDEWGNPELNIVSLSIEGRVATIVPIAKALSRGESVGTACSGQINGVPDPFNSLSLPTSEMTTAPWTFQLAQYRRELVAEIERSAPSPIADVPAQCLSLARIDKTALFRDVEDNADQILTALLKLVGFDFRGAHASRLGNLEAFVFPSATQNEISAVDLDYEGGAVRVFIKADNVPVGSDLIVRCSQRALGRVLSDDLRVISIAQLQQPIVFEGAADGPWAMYIDIWLRPAEGGPAKIWYSNAFRFLRHATVRAFLPGGNPVGSDDWLSTWGKTKASSEVAAALKRMPQLLSGKAMVGKEDPLWVTAEENARRLASTLAVDFTADRFFAGGLDASLFDLAKWLSSQASSSVDATDILFVDPDFDEFGVSFLSSIPTSAARYHVLTFAGPTRESALNDIIIACRSTGQARGRQQLEIGVVDSKTDSSAIYDRYIFIFDSRGQPLSGFQLSSSLSLKTRKAPILVNEISPHALPGVVEYVRALQQCDSRYVGQEATFRQLWPEPRRQVHDATPELKPTAADIAFCVKELERVTDDELAFDEHWIRLSKKLALTTREDWLSLLNNPVILAHLRRYLGRLPNVPDPSLRAAPLTPWTSALGSLARQPLGALYGSTWNVLKHWQGHSGIWSVEFAAETLERYAPAQLVSAFDDLVGRVSRESLPDGQFLAAVATVMGIIAEYLQAGILGPPSPVEGDLVKGRSPLSRALAAAAIGQRIVDVPNNTIDEGIKALEGLPEPVERAFALAECVYHLRVRANRSGSESEEDKVRRLRLFEELKRCWPERDVEWRAIVQRLDGPSFGIWSVSTTNDLLLPLVREQKLGVNEFVSFWCGELEHRWMNSLSGEKQFYADADAQLTQVVAWVIMEYADAPRARTLLEHASRLRESIDQIRARPFARSSNYDQWYHAVNTAIWMRAFAQLIAPKWHDRFDLGSLLKLAAVEGELSELDPTKLYRFASQIDAAAASRDEKNVVS